MTVKYQTNLRHKPMQTSRMKQYLAHTLSVAAISTSNAVGVLHLRFWAIAAGLLTCSISSLSADLTVMFTEDGGGPGIISVSYTGSLDFTSGVNNTFAYSRFINPAGGTVSFAGNGDTSKIWAIGGPIIVTGTSSPPSSGAIFAGYGTGGFVDDQLYDVTGDKIGTYVDGIVIDRSIASGEAISGSAKLNGTFASRGITAGTSWTNFTLDGQANTLTYIATTAPVSSIPEPSSMITVGGLLAGSLTLRRRKRA